MNFWLCLWSVSSPEVKFLSLYTTRIYNAEAGIRTPTSLRTLGPEPNASANSATSAFSMDYD